MLGDIAAGTGKPIGDFVKIFAKVKATGKVSLESLNQLAERGIPIYSALSEQLGVSRKEMLEMLSKRKVGFDDLNGALAATATGSGAFAGGMAAQLQTITGLFSTLRDNVEFAMRELGGEIISAFDFKGLMASAITMFQTLKTGIASMRPIFVATAAVVKAAFGAEWEIISVTFTSVTSALGLTGGSFMKTFMRMAAIATFSAKNWPEVFLAAFANLKLWLVQAGANFAHLFTGVMPALFSWLTSNWSSIFLDAAAFIGVVFTNIGKNIMDAMTVIGDFIACGGTKSLEFAFTPLMDGFGTAISSLPGNECETWFDLGFMPADYWQSHHFDVRFHARRTDAAQGNTSYAKLYVQLFEADGVTEITETMYVNNGSINDTWENIFHQDDVRTSRSSLPIMINAKLRLRQDYLGDDSHEIAQLAVYATYVPIEVKSYTCVPVGNGSVTNYTSTEATNWEAVEHGIATPTDAEILTITDTVGDVFLIMGPDPPADFFLPVDMKSTARVKVSTMDGNRHNTFLTHYEANETDSFGGVQGGKPPQAGAFFDHVTTDIVGINAVGIYYDWQEELQLSTFYGGGGGLSRDALVGWKLNTGSTSDNGVHTILEAETVVTYSALPVLSYVAFERLFPAVDETNDDGVVSTEPELWEAINTRVQLSDNTKYITFPNADAEVFFSLTDLPKDLDTVHHFMFWLKAARVSATVEYSDLFMQLFADDELTRLSDEHLMVKDVSTSANIWKHYGVLGVRTLSEIDNTVQREEDSETNGTAERFGCNLRSVKARAGRDGNFLLMAPLEENRNIG